MLNDFEKKKMKSRDESTQQSAEICEKTTDDTINGVPGATGAGGAAMHKIKNPQFGPYPESIVQKLILTVINKQKDKKLGIRVARTLNVSSVLPGSAAEGILKAGDLILSLNGIKTISRTQIEEQIPAVNDGMFKFEIKRVKPPKIVENEADVMKILPKAYDCAPGCRYIVGYICVYPGANLGIHIMSLDSKVYVTNAPHGTLAGEIFQLGDVLLSIDNIPVTTVKLCSSNIKEALCTKGWCRVLYERPISQFAKKRTKNALKAEKCLEIDPKLPDDIITICNECLKQPQIEPVTKGILKDRTNSKMKGDKRVVISQQSTEMPIGFDPFNLDLIEQCEKRDDSSPKNQQRKRNSTPGAKKKTRLGFFTRSKASEDGSNR